MNKKIYRLICFLFLILSHLQVIVYAETPEEEVRRLREENRQEEQLLQRLEEDNKKNSRLNEGQRQESKKRFDSLRSLPTQNYDPLLSENKITKLIFAATAGGGDSTGALEKIFKGRIILLINVVLGAVIILWITIIGVKYILQQGNEEDLSKNKRQFGWLLLGAAVISVAEFAGYQIFNPTKDILTLDAQGTNPILSALTLKMIDVKLYFEYLVIGIMLVVCGMSGYNLIIGGEGDEVIQQEKRFVVSFVSGIGAILLAEVIVRVFALQDMNAQAAVAVGIGEIIGVVNLILTFLGGTAAFMLILSSFYYVTSFGDEDQTSRAKRMIIVSVLGVVIALSAYTLARFLV